MNIPRTLLTLAVMAAACPCYCQSQEYGPPNRGEPGDEMIQEYLAREANRIHTTFLDGVDSQEDWEERLPDYRDEYLHMLGLSPMPEKTPLHATVTGSIEGDGYIVEMLHYQSQPQLYVTGNLYRPANADPDQQLPAVVYVCGHSFQGRSGNKTAYQSHGIWFARHGYICLVLDTLQLGEIESLHHGTYRENRWWWHSRGYTPAGVECLNGIRGIDYLSSRPDVDPDRIAVTGISGGGAATFWIAAADSRVHTAVPVSGMADLPSYVNNRVINGHCDCMFLYNTFQWPWVRIAALIAPRPLLFVNSDQDRIFPMDANERVINRLERVYSLYGRTDFVDAVVSIGGHAYRKDIRQAAYRFINTQLKQDPRLVQDSETDLITGERPDRNYPIPIDKLRVFPEDSDIPEDELNTTIDEHFVPMAEVEVPSSGGFEPWKETLVGKLRRVSFGYFPDRIPPAKSAESSSSKSHHIETEEGIVIPLKQISAPESNEEVERILINIANPDSDTSAADLVRRHGNSTDAWYVCEPRGIGGTRWTRKNPPNYVRRSHVLLGRTVDTGRVWDIIATARHVREKHGSDLPVVLVGEGASAVLAAYAGLWEPEIARLILHDPPLTHMDDASPQFLNVLRVCDIPDILGMLAPRPLTVIAESSDALQKTAAIYQAAEASDRFERTSH